MHASLRQSFVRPPSLLLLLGVMLSVTWSANAGTITQTRGFRFSDATPTSLNFDSFDTVLGTLDSVEISFAASRRHSWALWNASATAGAVSYEAWYTGTNFSVGGNVFGFADLHYGPTQTDVLAPTGFPDFLSQFLQGQAEFVAGLDPDFGPNAFQTTTLSPISHSFMAPTFAGVLGLSFNPGLFTLDATGIFSASLAEVAGDATVRYNYTPHQVADTGGTAGLTAAALALLVLARGRWRQLRAARPAHRPYATN